MRVKSTASWWRQVLEAIKTARENRRLRKLEPRAARAIVVEIEESWFQEGA